jgi:peroxiredoxin
MQRKYRFTFLTSIACIALPLISYCKPISSEDLVLFKKVAEKLMALQSIRYHYSREFSYPAENYHAKSEGEMFVDFGKENDLVGLRYQYMSSEGFSIFNNSELFGGDFKKKTINTTNRLKKTSFEGRSALYNSIVTLRNLLPLVIEDKNMINGITDTSINNQSYYVLKFETRNKLPNYLGTGFTPTTQELLFYHRLIVDRTTLLPITLLQTKKGSQDLNRTDFTKIETNPLPPKEQSWYYSSYLNEYKPEEKQSISIIKAGQKAPDWMLTNLLNGSKENKAQYKGQVILLEFWIKNCGYCIQAVPKLNALNKKYKPEDFKLLAINTEDSEKSAHLFVKNNAVNYTVLWVSDAEVSKNYGIAAFPQVVLIDKLGIVIYSGEFDVQKVSSLIDKAI